MSILDRMRRDRSIPRDATFRITQAGTDKLQEYNSSPESRILVALETHGSSNAAELAVASGLSQGKVERLIPQLVKAQYVQYAGATSELD